jgi:hypothetical protein
MAECRIAAQTRSGWRLTGPDPVSHALKESIRICAQGHRDLGSVGDDPQFKASDARMNFPV